MKTQTLSIALTLITMITFGQGFQLKNSENLKIDTSKSKIKWSCDYAFYFGGHYGFINFKSGYFIKNNESITGGEFIIDMTSIKSTDIAEKDGRESLDNHLKNADFFDVETYPASTLKITSVKYQSSNQMKIFADLTIKDVTKQINFQAEVDYDKKQMTTKFKIDRTLWGINYNSKQVEGALKDGLISDAIGFEVKLSL